MSDERLFDPEVEWEEAMEEVRYEVGDQVLWTDGCTFSVWGTVDGVMNNDVVDFTDGNGATYTVQAKALRRRPAPPKPETMLERALRTRDVWSEPFRG